MLLCRPSPLVLNHRVSLSSRKTGINFGLAKLYPYHHSGWLPGQLLIVFHSPALVLLLFSSTLSHFDSYPFPIASFQFETNRVSKFRANCRLVHGAYGFQETLVYKESRWTDLKIFVLFKGWVVLWSSKTQISENFDVFHWLVNQRSSSDHVGLFVLLLLS